MARPLYNDSCIATPYGSGEYVDIDVVGTPVLEKVARMTLDLELCKRQPMPAVQAILLAMAVDCELLLVVGANSRSWLSAGRSRC